MWSGSFEQKQNNGVLVGGGVAIGQTETCTDHEDVLGSLLFCHIHVRVDQLKHLCLAVMFLPFTEAICPNQ